MGKAWYSIKYIPDESKLKTKLFLNYLIGYFSTGDFEQMKTVCTTEVSLAILCGWMGLLLDFPEVSRTAILI